MVDKNTIKRVCAMQPFIQSVQSQLCHNNNEQPKIEFSEKQDLGYLNLRLTDRHNQALEKWLCEKLPDIKQVTTAQQVTVIGLSPSEWLLITHADNTSEILEKLNEILQNTEYLLTDVSGGTTTLNIIGEAAQRILEKGTYTDLHDSVLLPQMAVATQLAHAPAIIVKNTSDNYSVIIRRSYADHVISWAIDAAKPFGYRFL